ncbi:unnamed protein product, partial [Iphiclides podalirius]
MTHAVRIDQRDLVNTTTSQKTSEKCTHTVQPYRRSSGCKHSECGELVAGHFLKVVTHLRRQFRRPDTRPRDVTIRLAHTALFRSSESAHYINDAFALKRVRRAKTKMAAPPAAVVVERAYKYYGRQDKPDYKPVLNYLDMTVEKGIIYGLLGASGCGKTTLLSCIVGRRSLDSGNIWVLGGKPGEKGSGVPGPRVGYMPQDIALVAEFSVRDAVFYFGRIYGMPTQKLIERFEFLTSLLDLPSGGRLIKSLSGGQQRRVSLAAALVHEPELLILDEPTVGLDPVLRERIWDFLAELARGGTTVIITTHYIDETKQAHKIGLLRDGQLLAEDSPREILRKYDCDTLEDAFLKMALRQHEVSNRRRSTLTSSPDVIPEGVTVADSRYHSREDFNIVNSSTDMLNTKEKISDCRSKSKARYKAVLIKSIQQFSRHPGLLVCLLTTVDCVSGLRDFASVTTPASNLDSVLILDFTSC